MTRRILAATAVALALGTAPAVAATPESGYVGQDKLTQRWEGEAYGQPFNNFRQTQREICLAPFCDTFTLDVRDTGQLTLKLVAPGSAGYVSVEVVQPDGTVDFYDGSEGQVAQTIVYEEAPVGSYRIRIWPNRLIGLYDGYYTGRAELVLPAA